MRKRTGIATLAAVIVILVSVLVLSSETSEFYASLPPMSQCGYLPHPIPASLAKSVARVMSDPKFINSENGLHFLFSQDGLEVSDYNNGTSFNTQQLIFVHLLSNKAEDLIYISITSNGTITSSVDFNSIVSCVTAAP